MFYEEPEDQPQVSEVEAMNRGISLEELRDEKGIVDPQPPRIGVYERRLALFTQRRMEEAQFADGWHMLPDNIPINLQPWWKVAIWKCFLAGQSDGYARRRG
jgi:hypothetical protein